MNRLFGLFQRVSNEDLLRQGEEILSHLARLTQEVAETRGVIRSMAVLLKGLGDKIRELADDEEALNALADELDAGQAEALAAIEENKLPDDPPVVPSPVEK